MPDCDNVSFALGLCEKHYTRLRRYNKKHEVNLSGEEYIELMSPVVRNELGYIPSSVVESLFKDEEDGEDGIDDESKDYESIFYRATSLKKKGVRILVVSVRRDNSLWQYESRDKDGQLWLLDPNFFEYQGNQVLSPSLNQLASLKA